MGPCFCDKAKDLRRLLERVDGIGDEEVAHDGQEHEDEDGRQLQQQAGADGARRAVAVVAVVSVAAVALAAVALALPLAAAAHVHVLAAERAAEEHVEQLLGRHVGCKHKKTHPIRQPLHRLVRRPRDGAHIRNRGCSRSGRVRGGRRGASCWTAALRRVRTGRTASSSPCRSALRTRCRWLAIHKKKTNKRQPEPRPPSLVIVERVFTLEGFAGPGAFVLVRMKLLRYQK